MLFLILFLSISVDAQTSVPVFLQKNGYAKHIASVLSYVEDGKLQKAVKEQEKIREMFFKDKNVDKGKANTIDAYLYPVWDIANCLLMNTKEGRDGKEGQGIIGYDPWKAYQILRQSTDNAKIKSDLNEFFKQHKLQYSVTSIKSAIEASLIKEVANTGTEQAYDKLIATLYDYSSSHDLEVKREQIAFNECLNVNKVERLQQYLDKYKSFESSHERQIVFRRDSLAFMQMEESVNGCKEYLSSYPQSRYKDDVTKLLHKCEFDVMEQSVDGCKEYLRKYPNSEYAGKVKTMMERFAYAKATKEGTPEALAAFLNDFSSSDKRDETIRVLNDLLKKKYLGRQASLSELEHFIEDKDFGSYVDYGPYQVMYRNLMNLPTSAAMMDCKGMTGKVSIITNVSDNEYEEILQFNLQGLLTSQTNSRSGQNDSWEYDLNEKGEVCPVSKTDNKGKTTTYKTTFNNRGLISTITGNDGSSIIYDYNSDNSLKTVTHCKGSQKTQIDYYNGDGRIARSDRNGVTLAFEYDVNGNVVNMAKKRGNILMDQTSYEYESSNKYWTVMRQYNNGSYFLSKRRGFNTPQNQVKSVEKKQVDSASSSSFGSMNDDKVFDVVESMPAFPGGPNAMLEYLSRNVKYPSEAEEKGIQGRVIVTFIVECDGSITDVNILKSVNPLLDKEAKRLVKSMPHWIPGKQNGSPVRVKYTVPITFSIR